MYLYALAGHKTAYAIRYVEIYTYTTFLIYFDSEYICQVWFLESGILWFVLSYIAVEDPQYTCCKTFRKFTGVTESFIGAHVFGKAVSYRHFQRLSLTGSSVNFLTHQLKKTWLCWREEGGEHKQWYIT